MCRNNFYYLFNLNSQILLGLFNKVCICISFMEAEIPK